MKVSRCVCVHACLHEHGYSQKHDCKTVASIAVKSGMYVCVLDQIAVYVGHQRVIGVEWHCYPLMVHHFSSEQVSIHSVSYHASILYVFVLACFSYKSVLLG